VSEKRCLVKRLGEERYGWLLGFGVDSDSVHDYGNQCVGVRTWTTAIVEYENGEIDEVAPNEVTIIRPGANLP